MKVPTRVKYNGEIYHIRYIREAETDRKGEKTVAYINLPNETQIIGVAGRSANDNYNEIDGMIVAGKRLVRKVKKLSSMNRESVYL